MVGNQRKVTLKRLRELGVPDFMRGSQIPVPQTLEKLNHAPLCVTFSICVDDTQVVVESPNVGRQLGKVLHGPLQSRRVDDRLLEFKIVANGLGLAIELREFDRVAGEFLQPPEVGGGQATGSGRSRFGLELSGGRSGATRR